MSSHEALLNNAPSFGVNQVSISINVKTQEGHGALTLIEEQVRMGTRETNYSYVITVYFNTT